MLRTIVKATGQEFSLDEATLSPEALAFLLDYGFKQYISDGAAVAKRDAEGNVRPEAEVMQEKLEGAQARYDNILSGNFTRRAQGTRERILMEMLRAAAKAAKFTLPKGAALEAMKADFERKYKKTIDKRVALAEEEISLDGLDFGAQAEG